MLAGPRIYLFTFCATINKRSKGLWFLIINQLVELGVDPATGLDAIEPRDDDLKLLVEFVVLVLDATVVRGDCDTLYTPHDEAGGNLSLGLSYI